jgi:hypothetical protein
LAIPAGRREEGLRFGANARKGDESKGNDGEDSFHVRSSFSTAISIAQILVDCREVIQR